MRIIVPAMLLVFCLWGCAPNPFAKFYHDQTQGMSEQVAARLLPPEPIPKIVTVSKANYAEQMDYLEEHGYFMLGYSAFTSGGDYGRADVDSQAVTVGADVVLVSEQYERTETGLRKVSNTSTTTEQASEDANITGTYGRVRGNANYSGESNTTTTSYVPYNYSVYGTQATFWRKMKPPILGIRFEPLPDELRKSLQTNAGVYVSIVLEGTPAYYANILKSDVIMSIDGKDVYTASFNETLKEFSGKTAVFMVFRESQEKSISIKLN